MTTANSSKWPDQSNDELVFLAKRVIQDKCETWPFPPATGPVPWTKVQVKAYEAQQLANDEQGIFNIAPVAQRSEQGTHNPLVDGSNPFRRTNF